MGEVVFQIKSYSLSRNVETNKDTGFKYVHYGDIHRNIAKLLSSENNLPSIQKGNYEFLQKGDLVIADASEDYEGIGNSCLIDCFLSRNIVAGLHTIALRPTEVNSLFLYYLLHTDIFSQYGKVIATGTKVFGITAKNLLNFEFNLPSETEQQAIGEFFRQLDDTIAFHQRTQKKYQNLKKSYLEKMFAKINYAWKQRKLGEIGEYNPNGLIPNEFFYVDLECVIGTELLFFKRYNKENAPSRAQRLAKKGDVFFQAVRPYQKNNYLFDLNEDNFIFSTGYIQIRPSLDSYFLLSSLQNQHFVDSVMEHSTGTSYPAINTTDFKKLEIFIPPTKAEQQAIGEFFRQLDDTIAFHQRELEKYQQLKQVLLDQLFV
ncbi:restriction endonuclease subunit S [Moraxella sp. ZY210820]|nr:restriction endonuclease subunit S [Moraxella sp. ZY210820]WLF83465.1 restriction endonuclease subunit S [Moraxella sp. ZY210820]